MDEQDELRAQLRSLRERMDALTAANVRLLQRVAALEARLGRLDGAAAPAADAPVEPVPAAAPFDPAIVSAESVRSAEEPLVAAEQSSETARSLETRVGLAWVNRVAVLTCVLAAAFFFKYASDNQWIGPEARVAVGAVLGLGALAWSARFFRRSEWIVTQGLAGIGVSLLYLSAYAAFSFYQLLSHSAAFAGCVAVTALAAAVAWSYNSQAVAVLAVLGGYASPVLLSTHEPRPVFLMAYTLTLAAGFAGLSRGRAWGAVERIALAGSLALTGAAVVTPHPRLAAGGYLLAMYAIFASSPLSLTAKVAQFVFPVFVPVVWRGHPLGAFGTLFLFAKGGFYLADRRGWPPLPWISFVSIAIQTALFVNEHSNLRNQSLAGAAVLFVLFFGWIPWRAAVRGVTATRWDLITAAGNAVGFFGLLYLLFEGTRPDALTLLGWLAVGLGVLHAGAGKWLEPRDRVPAQLYFGIAAAFAILTAPLQFSRFGIAMAWALEGAALAWVAARTNTSIAAAAAQLVLLCGLPFLEDAPLLAWITVAACWLLASQWFPAPRWKAAAYVAGHLLLLAGISIELSQWAVQRAAEGDASAVSSTVFSVTAALYAVVLAMAGVASRTQINRILGLALIGLVIAKLYLRDVWELRMLYRVIAFAALGGILLLLSMLYSRFRGRIERLWLKSSGDN
jgi:hypothetical protein